MPYQVNWYIENQIIYTHYSGIMSPDDLRESLQKCLQMIESSPREIVHAISDVGDVVEAISMKESLNILRETGTHPRSGWNFTIRQKSSMMKMVAAMGSSIFNLRYRTFDTLDESLRYLKDFDQNISWEQVDERFIKQPIP